MTNEGFARGRDGRSTDLPSGGGVLPWVAASLNFCSRCGSRLVFGTVEGEDRDRLGCAACGHIAYVNPRLVVTTVPITEAGEIVGLYTRLEAMVVTIVFEARIVGGTAAPTPEATEVAAFAPEAIPWPEIAFKTTVYALRDWLELRRPDVEAPTVTSGR